MIEAQHEIIYKAYLNMPIKQIAIEVNETEACVNGFIGGFTVAQMMDKFDAFKGEGYDDNDITVSEINQIENQTKKQEYPILERLGVKFYVVQSKLNTM